MIAPDKCQCNMGPSRNTISKIEKVLTPSCFYSFSLYREPRWSLLESRSRKSERISLPTSSLPAVPKLPYSCCDFDGAVFKGVLTI